VGVPPLLAFALVACGDDSGAADAGGTGSGGSAACGDGCDFCLEPRDDDQTAVQTAFVEVEDGETICLAKGTFRFDSQLDLAAPDVTVRGAGMDETMLDFSKQDLGGNAISVTGDDTVLEGFTIHESGGDGIRAEDVDGFTAREIAVLWDESVAENPGYGLYPVGSSRILIERCQVSGASDTGIYVGQSSRIVVRDNEVYGNVAGIEIENSMDAEVSGNHAHDNTAGFLTFNLPELPVQGGARANFHDNVSENNNLANFAPPGNIVADVPAGTGFLVLATDDNEIHHNTISGNETVGVLVISYTEILGSYQDENYDEFSEGNWIHDNTFEDNGAMPHDLIATLFAGMQGPDIGWDGCLRDGVTSPDEGDRNCISDNGDARYVNVNFVLCGGSGEADMDDAPATCEHEALPSVEL
jgi:parallel beta-helix repeat protein